MEPMVFTTTSSVPGSVRRMPSASAASPMTGAPALAARIMIATPAPSAMFAGAR